MTIVIIRGLYCYYDILTILYITYS